jgi:hypothetical protein
METESAKLCFDITLYALAAFEASLIHSSDCQQPPTPFVHKLTPFKNGESVINPMHNFFTYLMEKLECPSTKELAQKLPSLTKRKAEIDYDSQLRMIRRWMGGEPMAWELVLAIRDKFFQNNDAICVMYAAARLLQALFNETNKLVGPIWNSEDEVIDLFQKYHAYQQHHATHFNN